MLLYVSCTLFVRLHAYHVDEPNPPSSSPEPADKETVTFSDGYTEPWIEGVTFSVSDQYYQKYLNQIRREWPTNITEGMSNCYLEWLDDIHENMGPITFSCLLLAIEKQTDHELPAFESELDESMKNFQKCGSGAVVMGNRFLYCGMLHPLLKALSEHTPPREEEDRDPIM